MLYYLQFYLNCSSVPDLLPDGCRRLLRPGAPGAGQHRALHVGRVAAGGGGGDVAAAPRHSLPDHHQPSRTDVRGDA